MIYRVRHVTKYRYANPVDLGTHWLHLQPRPLPWQHVLACDLRPDPAPGRVVQGEDCFGNRVTWMFLDKPHPSFDVTLEASVEVGAPPPPPAEATPSWQDVSAAAFAGAGSFAAAEFLFESPRVVAVPEARDYAERSFTSERPVLAALLDLNHRIRRDFAFRSGVTTVNTPVRQVLAQRMGVCQDFPHLMIAGLRSLGLPARYVSGYIRTMPREGQARRIGSDQSHAWVGCWLGPEHGWVDLDPTNGVVVSDEHVVLGWGRDFGDVSPIQGMILGGGKHTVTVGVDLEPVSIDGGSGGDGSSPPALPGGC